MVQCTDCTYIEMSKSHNLRCLFLIHRGFQVGCNRADEKPVTITMCSSPVPDSRSLQEKRSTSRTRTLQIIKFVEGFRDLLKKLKYLKSIRKLLKCQVHCKCHLPL